MVERRVTKGCCGKTAVLITVSKPVRKEHIPLFTEAGFIVPENYVRAGLLYVKKGGLIATCTFGICNINVRCPGHSCEDLIKQFEDILRKIESS
jgi:hypothetical protein